MQPRFHALLTATALLLGSTTAFADRSNVTFTPVSPTEVGSLRVGTPVTPIGDPCLLGETREFAGFVSGYLFPPDDTYYTLLRPGECGDCGATGVMVSMAHVVLGFNEVCDIPVEISVVGSLGDPLCPVPDLTRVLCPPTLYSLSPPDVGGWDFGLALPPGCCITSPAFLKVRVLDAGNCSLLPLVGAVVPPCNTCFSYNDNPAFGFVDMCIDPFWPAAAGNPMMYAEAGCCDPTHTKAKSWGRLKTLYR